MFTQIRQIINKQTNKTWKIKASRDSSVFLNCYKLELSG